MKTMFAQDRDSPSNSWRSWYRVGGVRGHLYSPWQPEDGPQYLAYKGTTYTGYLAMCAAINRAWTWFKTDDPEFIQELSPKSFGNLLVRTTGFRSLLRTGSTVHQVGTILATSTAGSSATWSKSATTQPWNSIWCLKTSVASRDQ